MSRTIGAIGALAVLSLVAVAGPGLGNTVFTYDAAGHLTGVSNTDNDVFNCGAREAVCSGDPRGTAVCVEGACSLDCVAGYGFDAETHSCVDLATNLRNCGMVGRVCFPPAAHGGATCTNGVCGAYCDSGFTLTNGQCVDLEVDPGNCGSPGVICPQVPGYIACCSAGVCGASAGNQCFDIRNDPSSCGYIGHTCPSFATQGPACSAGLCVAPGGTPSVSTLNALSARQESFRAASWAGIVLAGKGLDYVTFLELEDWGLDTVDGYTDGLRSRPTFQGLVLPSGNGGPMIHFRQTPTEITIDGTSLQFQFMNDPSFVPQRWYKMRVHYMSKGSDRYFTFGAPISFDQPPPIDLPAPRIVGVSTFYASCEEGNVGPSYDPATGLLTFVRNPSLPARAPTHVMTIDYEREVPVLTAAPEGLYLPPGLDSDSIISHPIDQRSCALLVYSHDPTSGELTNVATAGIIVRGTDLWNDGPLLLSNPVGVPTSDGGLSGMFFGDRIVMPRIDTIADFAFIEFGSMRGTAATPWPLNWIGPPVIERVDAPTSDDVCKAWDITCPPHLSTGVTTSFTGEWFRHVDRAYLYGPSGYDAFVHLYEDLAFQAIDDGHITLTIPGSGPVARGVIQLVDCNGAILYEYGTYDRSLCLQDSRHGLAECVLMYADPHSGVTIFRVAEDGFSQCSATDPDPDPPPDPVVLPGGGSGGCTNVICPP